MIHAIPNPTKSISVPVNVMDARKVVKDLPKVLAQLGHEGYILNSSDDFMGVYIFGKTEALSLGVNITITVTGNESMTQINLEVARVIGTFDQWYEVTNAQRHIENIMKCLSIGMDPNSEARMKKALEEKEYIDSHKLNPLVSLAIIVGVIVMVASVL
jgi:hypothetical protein